MAGEYTLDAEAVSKAFARIEDELLGSMVRNLSSHRAEEDAAGIDWAQWQAAQIAELDAYARDNALRYGPAFDALNGRISDLIGGAYSEGWASQERALLAAVAEGAEAIRQEGFLRMPRARMDALIRATHSDMMRAEHATLRQAQDIYRQVIFDAQVYATSGAGTYGRAIDMATRDFLARGVNGIRYRDGSMHSIREYSQMAVRTATKRAAMVAEGDARRAWGVHTIFVNYRTDACPECMEWVGRVLIDDVYSGGTAEEAAEAGYPLLSEAMAQGLFHPNCRDTCSTYFEGISDLPEKPTPTEKARGEAREAEEQKLDQAEDTAEKYRRLERFSLDMEDKRHYGELADEWEQKPEEPSRPRRGQIDTGISGMVKGKDLERYNRSALESIMDETGYGERDAVMFQQTMQDYLGGDYGAYVDGKVPEKVAILDEGLSRMPVYDGTITRGMHVGTDEMEAFSQLSSGDTVRMRSVSSWTSNSGVAETYGQLTSRETNTVILECISNESAVGVQHVSKWGTMEAEVLAPSTASWQVVESTTVDKYEYLRGHFEELERTATNPASRIVARSSLRDLETHRGEYEGVYVTIVKVKEIAP